jgi:integrase
VGQGVKKWLNICEKEGRNGREPVTRYTLDNYEYRAAIIEGYAWGKELRELTKPDVIEFRSWLLETYSRDVAHKPDKVLRPVLATILVIVGVRMLRA